MPADALARHGADEGDQTERRQEMAAVHQTSELLKDWKLTKCIGWGSQSNVWEVRSRMCTTGKMAVKLMRMCPRAKDEVAVHNELRKHRPHANIAHLIFHFCNQ